MSGDDASAEAPAEDTVVHPPTIDGLADTPFTPFDELHEEFQPGPLLFSRDPNGTPVPVDQTTPSNIPALSTESLVCMGDYSSFVVRDLFRRVTDSFPPERVERMPDGNWYVLKDPTHAPPRAPRDYLEVEPVRPPCQHYVRQKTEMLSTSQNFEYPRLCSARRTTEGTFMSVRDMGLYACDMREPVDIASIQVLDEFDRMKVEQGRRRVHLPIASAAPPPEGPGGIFTAK